MSNAVASVYEQVISDVVEHVKKDFEDMGVEKEVLEELRQSWTQKVRSSRVATWSDQYNNFSEPATVKYKDEDRVHYEAAANLAMLATPASMEAAKHLYMPTKNGSVPTPASSVAASGIATVMLPAQNQSLVDQQNLDQKIYPTAPNQAQELETFVEQKIPESSRLVTHSMGDYSAPPQVLATQQPTTDDGRRNTAHNGSSYADDDEINSDLDDPDEEENAENEESQNIILCLYDKVTRTKNKWKCQLKDGVMSVNGKDYLFHKGTGDFEF